jgi:carboxynorspermidine decarboxylase
MESNRFRQIDLGEIKTPCYIVDEELLEKNLGILSEIQQKTAAKILLALKAFSMYSTFPLIKRYLHGVCASSINEARLGREEFDREVHVFAPAYKSEDIEEVIKHSDYIIFNSFNQWKIHKESMLKNNIKCGLRVNPQYSEVEVELYDPCAENSRLGIKIDEFEGEDLSGITGLHFHVMCEQNSDTLKRVLSKFEEKFGDYIKNMEWVNFGGGHHITRDDYDRELLCELINDFKEKYDVEIYLEPGEAVALNTGILIASVVDILERDLNIAILDTSAETHMPDVLAMPYRPEIIGAGLPDEFSYMYRLGGITCLAGDVIGDYSFPEKLKIGDKLIFRDMAIYSMVKNTTFNGINLPAIALQTKNNEIKIIKKFGYEDFKSRL